MSGNNKLTESDFSKKTLSVLNNNESCTEVENSLNNIYALLNDLDAKLKNDIDLKNQIVDLIKELGVNIDYEIELYTLYDIIRNLNVIKECTAEPSDVLSGKMYVNNDYELVEGNIVNNGDIVITPSNARQMINPGFYNNILIEGSENLIPANILAGVVIFGVNGTMTPAPTITYGGTNELIYTNSVSGFVRSSPTVIGTWNCEYGGQVLVYVTHGGISGWGGDNKDNWNAKNTHVTLYVDDSVVYDKYFNTDSSFPKTTNVVNVYPGCSVKAVIRDNANSGHAHASIKLEVYGII